MSAAGGRVHSIDDRLALSLAEAARALGVSERHVREILSDLPHVHLGKSGRARRRSSSSVAVAADRLPPPETATVFPNFSGGMLIPEYVRNNVFSRIVRRALGERRRFSPHGLRHTWASLHMARGTPLKWTQEQGG